MGGSHIQFHGGVILLDESDRATDDSDSLSDGCSDVLLFME